MLIRKLLVSLLFTSICFGQGLPDRDELVKKFMDENSADQAVRELYKHFGMGGLRTIIRNVNDLPLERRLRYGTVFSKLDLNRFINDINNNVEKAQDAETRAMWLMVLSREGRGIAADALDKYINDESQDIRVRLAAQNVLCQIQSPERYNRFYELAEQAVVDPNTGRNDLLYAGLSKENKGFYYYTKSRTDKDKVSHGVILSALAFADHTDTEIFDNIVKLRNKKYYDMLINRAVQVGGVSILDSLAGEKKLKKWRDKISIGKATAGTLAQYQTKCYNSMTHDPAKIPLGPALPAHVKGTGRDGYSGGYAVVKVGADGKVEIVEKLFPYGGSHNFDSLPAKTVPAFENWEPVESYVVLFAP